MIWNKIKFKNEVKSETLAPILLVFKHFLFCWTFFIQIFIENNPTLLAPMLCCDRWLVSILVAKLAWFLMNCNWSGGSIPAQFTFCHGELTVEIGHPLTLYLKGCWFESHLCLPCAKLVDPMTGGIVSPVESGTTLIGQVRPTHCITASGNCWVRDTPPTEWWHWSDTHASTRRGVRGDWSS